jgi:hypothetical protein
MGTWVIKIADDNAAFEDQPATECARILRELADWFYAGACDDCNDGLSKTLRDLNGNTVGYASYFRDDEPTP